MDIALELMDTFVFDYAYSAVFPPHAAAYKVDGAGFGANATAQTFTTWQYEPSSFLFTLEPSRYAYETSVPRDNIFRQYFSLFLITW